MKASTTNLATLVAATIPLAALRADEPSSGTLIIISSLGGAGVFLLLPFLAKIASLAWRKLAGRD